MPTPQFKAILPELMDFITLLAREKQQGIYEGWPDVHVKVREFYTPGMMAKIEAVVPGWGKMSSYGNGATLLHVSSALASLLLRDEYQSASPEQQNLMLWIVLFHDVEKVIHEDGTRDHIHGFKGAANAGCVLPDVGFTITDDDAAKLSAWHQLTMNAHKFDAASQHEVQDNDKLPEILGGIDAIFGVDAPAALVIKGVLFHLAIDVNKEWPQAVPLTDEQIKQYISPALFPLLKAMMLIDNDAWAFFAPERKARHNTQTLAVFEHVQSLIGA